MHRYLTWPNNINRLVILMVLNSGLRSSINGWTLKIVNSGLNETIVAKLHVSLSSCNLPKITIAGCSGRFKILVICCTPKRHWVAVLHCHFHSFDIETRKPPTQPELDHSNVFRHASGFTRSTIGLGNRLVCTRIKTKKSSRRKKTWNPVNPSQLVALLM